ncbi:MAG: type II toxin-antitoxin system VapC family toxin [Methylobacteriaceae bacterium]|nr:type II toxin-antitoxin system VapC family toxin [Methylobacteriaceae bacterium]
MSGPRRVMIDANILDHLHRGNAQVAKALLDMRAAGVELYISRHAYDEAVTTPLPRHATSNRLILDAFKFKIAASDANLVTAMEAANGFGAGKTHLSPLDLRVAIDARSSNAEIWSLDKGFVKLNDTAAKSLGVAIAPESQIKVVNGSQDYRIARKLLNLPVIEIDLNGNVKPSSSPPAAAPPPAPADPASPTAPAGGAPTPPVKVKGGAAAVQRVKQYWVKGGGVRYIRGAALAALAGILYQKVLKKLLEQYIESIETRDIPAMLAKKRDEIRRAQLRGYRQFAVISIRIVTHSYTSRLAGNQFHPWLTAELRSFKLATSAITSVDENPAVDVKYRGTFVEMVDTQDHTYSFEVAFFNDEQLNALEQFRSAYMKIGTQYRAPMSDSENILRNEIIRQVKILFGDDAPELAGFPVY